MGDGQKTESLIADREKIISNSCTDNIYHPSSITCADTTQYLKDNMAAPNICGDSTEYISDKTATHSMGTSKREKPTDNSGAINIQKLQELGNNPIITSYLNQRGIHVMTAKPYCHEINYRVNQKSYFGIAHRNNKGWCIRNKYWKGCTAQGYSYYQNHQDSLLIFEGIFDHLSYIELNPEKQNQHDYLLLNSLVNLKDALPKIIKYTAISLYLDNDKPGRKATKEIMRKIPNTKDFSELFSSYKDLNEYYLKKEKGYLLKEE